MSQKRQEARDRLQAEHDYRANLKAELEIRQLHEKLDHLILRQWQRLIEIQQNQMDVLEALNLHEKWALSRLEETGARIHERELDRTPTTPRSRNSRLQQASRDTGSNPTVRSPWR